VGWVLVIVFTSALEETENAISLAAAL